jgi:hypothetical protein
VQDGLCRREICSSSLGDHVQFCGQVAGIELKKSATSSTREIRIVFREVGWGLGNSLGQALSADRPQISALVSGFGWDASRRIDRFRLGVD